MSQVSLVLPRGITFLFLLWVGVGAWDLWAMDFLPHVGWCGWRFGMAGWLPGWLCAAWLAGLLASRLTAAADCSRFLASGCWLTAAWPAAGQQQGHQQQQQPSCSHSVGTLGLAPNWIVIPRAGGGGPFDLGPGTYICCLLYTSPSPRDRQKSRMPSSA